MSYPQIPPHILSVCLDSDPLSESYHHAFVCDVCTLYINRILLCMLLCVHFIYFKFDFESLTWVLHVGTIPLCSLLWIEYCIIYSSILLLLDILFYGRRYHYEHVRYTHTHTFLNCLHQFICKGRSILNYTCLLCLNPFWLIVVFAMINFCC